MLKADLHLHTKEDPEDNLSYSAYKLIDTMSQRGYNVISITNHNSVFYNKRIADYAKKRGILLIPGVELRLEKKDILVYNIKQKGIKDIKKIADLRKIRRRDTLIVAPHPFFIVPHCIGKKLIEYMDLFDGVEYTHFYMKCINRNKKLKKVFKVKRLPVIGNSDAHNLWQVGYTYTLIDSKKNINDVIKAIKADRINLITRPLPIFVFIRIVTHVLLCMLFGKRRFTKSFK